MKKYIVLLSLTVFGLFSFSTYQPEATSREIVNTMLGSIKKVKTLTFTFKSWERFKDGKDVYSEAVGKLQERPFKVYLLSKAPPNEGVEVIYNHDLYGDKAAINPGGWLPNVKLDPYGSRMRNGQHHTIMSTGFEMFYTIISKAVKKADTDAPGQFESYFKYEGDVTWEGRTCYKVVITDPTFQFVDYTVKEGETIRSIAERDAICGYLIIDRNEKVDDFDDLDAGMVIKKPSSYAKKTVLYIDKQYNLPVVQIMYDDKGQFERYEFHDLKWNPTIQPIEFTKDYDGYGY